QRSGDPVLVSWLGGEPLLWGPLRELTTAFVHRLGLRVSVTTNGTALSASATRAHLLAHYAEVTMSVDGMGERHDILRGWPGGFASLRAAVRALADEKRRAGRGPLLRANVVLMRDNVAEFAALCGELADWGIEEVTFNQLGGNDRPEFYPAHRLSAHDVERLAAELPLLRDALARRGVRIHGGAAYLDRIRSSASGRALPVHDCDPGESFLFVSETGLVSPCSFTGTEYGVPLAELRTAEDISSLRSRFGAARARARAAACGDCPSTHVFAKFAAAYAP
ncbi:MAG TPA: radical SAM protein, partial [Gemmatimonadaceae bacterium]|nr:radical SAM protein [Gemmatimonadaceae bacterium]